MASEGGLWTWIKKGGLPGKWERIHTRKIPDTICCPDPRKPEHQFFVELKEIEHFNRDGTVHLTLTSSQIAFFTDWPGEKYIFAQIGKERFWFKGDKLVVNKRDAIHGPFNRGRFKPLV